MNLLRSIFIVAASLLVATSCNDTNDPPVDTFDRSAMLRSVADSLVIPSLAVVKAHATNVATKINVMSIAGNPSDAEITEIRSAIAALTLSWQSVISYNFGPAEGALGSMVENIATFPANVQDIDAFIIARDTSFQNFKRDTRGLSALDYLFFRAPVSNIRQMMSGDTAAGVRSYARAVANAILAEITKVHQAWIGSYRQQFLSQTGTDAGSSVSLLFNNFSMGYELLKNYKVALPLGKMAGQSNVEPTRVEAFYQTTSLELAHAQFKATVDLWYGRTPGGDTIPSFRSYLRTVANGDRLITDTETQIGRAENAFGALGTSIPLSTLVSSNPAACETLSIELQKLTRFFKSEMSSLLGIAITYSSGDGD